MLDNSFSKFLKLKVTRLELKRFLKNTHLGNNMRARPSSSKRKEIHINASTKDKLGMFNTIENELSVYAYVKSIPHEVFTCPYSDENKEKLQSIVDDYNNHRFRV